MGGVLGESAAAVPVIDGQFNVQALMARKGEFMSLSGDIMAASQPVRWSVKAIPRLLGGSNRLHECDPRSKYGSLLVVMWWV